jgi:hypothetical protein
MKARLLLKERRNLDDDTFTELVVWEVPTSVPGSAHSYKYRLALVVNGVCVLRYDNEAGKGDHRHVGDKETAYRFTSPVALFDDFMADVARWRDEHFNS